MSEHPNLKTEPKEDEISRSGLLYTDRVVIITGGAKGIGAGCARVFVEAGAKVMICDTDKVAGEELANNMTDIGPGRCLFEVADMSKAEDIQRVVEKTIKIYGGLDCLVNNAGYHPPYKPVDDFSVEEVTKLLQTNFIGYFVASQHALPHLRKTKGSIVNIGSMSGKAGEEGATAYAGSKAAIHGFTKALAIDESRHSVRVNCVIPGNILSYGRKTGIASMPPQEGAKFDKFIDSLQCAGRSGTCEEVGQLCLFLASDAASYITGVEVLISGGMELGYGPKYPPRLNF